MAIESNPEKRKKICYIGAPAVFALELACQHVNAALRTGNGIGNCYLVGSAMERPDWRDVDIRYIMADEDFAALFPNVDLTTGSAIWGFDPRWLLFNTAIAKWLQDQTGLPVDFQIQPQTFANERHDKSRSAIGLRIAKRENLAELGQPFVDEMELHTIPAIVDAVETRQEAALEDRGILAEGKERK